MRCLLIAGRGGTQGPPCAKSDSNCPTRGPNFGRYKGRYVIARRELADHFAAESLITSFQVGEINDEISRHFPNTATEGSAFARLLVA
jgi:hypothetical protein